ncbi:hypothetical protein PYW07_009626 [Mythimna separata]|uniref:DDE Tnp4 domain-containing protein n=1 Tax=Mythimna separata TaxID=271217 RepID=A0AAD7YCN4_MYTSE|nr:hypothetical protein PYW07_009626 [Mythimna separata]
MLDSRLRRLTKRNNAITPVDQILLALQFYASGSFLRCVGDSKGVHKSTVCRAIHTVSKELAKLRPHFIFMPRNENERKATVNSFYNISRFPKVVGAIDCTHVYIQSPGGNNAEYYRNRKDSFSLNVQVVADANCYIKNIVARWPGGSHDSHIFDSSNIKGRMEDGEFGDTWLLGDRGYALRSFLLTPLANPTTAGEHLYNESHIRTRNVVERTFGCWKRRFPAIGSKLRVNLKYMQAIIVATAVLHNICRKMNEEQPPDLVDINEEIDIVHETGTNYEDSTRGELISSYFDRLADNHII